MSSKEDINKYYSKKMKNKFNALVVLSALAITTTSFAQTKAPNSANYKQQNQLLGRKQTATAPAQVQLNNDYSTNPLANHRNYKAQGTAETQSKTVVVAVNNNDSHSNYKQKNLLTRNGRDVRYKKVNKADSTLIVAE
ncbi:hypothetical protein GCM10027035_38540 [Emticicia sediminis]